jgi:hypothetical protein
MGRLNGWQRIGAVLSILWLLGGAVYSLSEWNERKEGYRKYLRNVCYQTSDDKERNNCLDLVFAKAERAYPVSIFLGGVLIRGVIPIILGWGVALISVKTYKWIRVGFQK